MKIQSRICDLLGIRHPVLLGGMSGITDGKLVAAVGAAGGMGFLGSGGMTPATLRREIQQAKVLGWDRPCGVNLLLKDPELETKIKIVLDEKVAAVTTGAGNPESYVPRLQAAGIKIMPVVSSLAMAERMEAIGADAVIAEGMESGGHVGDVGTCVLVPLLADHLSIPVIAAGGIADTRGLLAAFLLGAEAVQMGTIFLCAEECRIHANYKSAVIHATERSTVVTGRSVGRPVRSIKNLLTRRIQKLEAQGASLPEINALRHGKLQSACDTGDVVESCLMIGQAACLIRETLSVKDIFDHLLLPAVTVLKDRLIYRLIEDQNKGGAK